MHYCTNCCTPIREGTEDCPKCGATIALQRPNTEPPTKICPYCGEPILAVALKCKHCGELQNEHMTAPKHQPKKSGAAAVLSALIPGLGQIYRGHIAKGFLWFLATIAGTICLIIPGIVIYVLCIKNAYEKE